MHSIVILFSLICSVFAAPIVNAPVNADTLAGVVSADHVKANAPVKAAIGNVEAERNQGLNDVASGNKVSSRDLGNALGYSTSVVDGAAGKINLLRRHDVVNAPVDANTVSKAVIDPVAKADVPVKAAVGNVKLDHNAIANGVLSENKIVSRDLLDVLAGEVDLPKRGDVVNAPVDTNTVSKAVVDPVAKAYVPAKAAVGNVKLEHNAIANDVLSGNTADLRRENIHI